MNEETKTTETAETKSTTSTPDSGTDIKSKALKYGLPVAGAVAGAFAGKMIAKKMGKKPMLFMIIGGIALGVTGYMVGSKMSK